MVTSTVPDDLGSRIVAAGGASNFLSSQIRDTSSLRQIRSIAAQCETEREQSTANTSGKTDASLRGAAKQSLHDARARLEEIRARATGALFEHQERQRELEALLGSFKELEEARAEANAVAACRGIADAYIRALRPLALHQRDGSMAEMDLVAEHIEKLIEMVDGVRRKGSKFLFGDDVATNERIIKSIENRAVDAVIKARAVFVNVLDNEFRRFGWPMKVPVPGEHDSVIESVNFYGSQLGKLQRVASVGDYVPERTRWHRGISDSWAVAAILRAPLARFKYHFLERVRPDGNGTSRFDRPEWAAEFALERIREAAPFLGKVAIEGPKTAQVKFAEGFCRVFAEKVAYDCELAMRVSKNDADADGLIAHASETAKQFDAKLREGVIHVSETGGAKGGEEVFASSLHVLSMNESFLAMWASSELRLADSEVNRLLDRALDVGYTKEGEDGIIHGGSLRTREELEQVCNEVVEHIGNASQKCRALEAEGQISKFLKLTELPLLHSIRARLKDRIEIDDLCPTTEQILQSGRAAFCAQLLADALEDRSVDSLYLSQEKMLGRGFYDDEITRLRRLHSSTSRVLCEAVTSIFVDGIKTGYMDQARFGEISAPDAAVVLTHDVSESLVNPLTSLENSLVAIKQGILCRKTASTIWRPVATKLDRFFFDEVVLQCFAGGSRNAMAVASAANSYLTPVSCARMARQMAFDATTFVSTFSAVSTNPEQFLPSSAECPKILRIASTRVLLPSVPPKQEDEEVLEALRAVVESDEDDVVSAASEVLRLRAGTPHISPREALELLAIGGLRFAIRMM